MDISSIEVGAFSPLGKIQINNEQLHEAMAAFKAAGHLLVQAKHVHQALVSTGASFSSEDRAVRTVVSRRLGQLGYKSSKSLTGLWLSTSIDEQVAL